MLFIAATSAHGLSHALECRVCAGLAYNVQRLSPDERALWAVEKIAARLGVPSYAHLDLCDSFPDKPPGMWCTTYLRHITALAAAENRRVDVALSRSRPLAERVLPGDVYE